MRKFDPQFKDIRENYEDAEHPMKELGQKALSEKLGISRQTVIGLENGNSNSISFDVLEAYCNFFDVSADYLLGFSKVPDDKPNIKMISDYTGMNVDSIEMLHDLSEMDEFHIQAVYQTIQYMLDPTNKLLQAIAMYLFYPDIDGVLANDNGKSVTLRFVDNDKIPLTLKGTNKNLQISAKDFKDIILLDNIKKILQEIKTEKEGELNGKETTSTRKRSRKRS